MVSLILYAFHTTPFLAIKIQIVVFMAKFKGGKLDAIRKMQIKQRNHLFALKVAIIHSISIKI